MNLNLDDGETAEAVAEVAANVPMAAIVKAAKAAKKRGAKKAAVAGKKKKAAVPKKVAKVAKVAKPKKAAGWGKGTRRGPKGRSHDDVPRAGEIGFGRAVRKARKAKEWGQTECARRCGIGQPSLSNIENGTVKASAKLREKIEKVLGL